VALVRTNVLEERITSMIRVTKIDEIGTLAVTNNRLLVTANVPSSLILVTQMMETILSSELSVLTIVTRRNIPGDGILQLCMEL
jgi:hypothetical protein